MSQTGIAGMQAEISVLSAAHAVGRVVAVQGGVLRVSGLSVAARLGDRVRVVLGGGGTLTGEVLQLDAAVILVLPDTAADGVALGDRVRLLGAPGIAPSDDWIGRVIDPFGAPLDGRPLLRGPAPRPLRAPPPEPAARRALGCRLETGMAVFNTLLPIVRGQRMGLFAGAGVGKSMLLGHLGRHMQADVVVVALIGERGRELGEFVRDVLGPEGMRRAVIIAATSDRSPLVRRRCAWTAMPVLRGFPASTSHAIMALCERAGPGTGEAGDITALFTVLVAGSDMDEPVADILRGVLDGHVVLDREIAERGRYPAIDALRSVSRSLPRAASTEENALIARARGLLGRYARSETMLRAGLYAEGGDPGLDQAIRAWPELDAFLAVSEPGDISNSFARLSIILRRAGGQVGAQGAPPAA